MGYRVIGKMHERWQPREGLEGPYQFANGQVLYYDPKQGQYWDPTTDFYIDNDYMHELHLALARYLAG